MAAPLAAGDPPPPFGRKAKVPVDARIGVFRCSDGRTLVTAIFPKGHKTLRFYDRGRKKYLDLRFKKILRMESEVEQEWIEQQWRWKEGGQDEKVYFGPKYPARKHVWTFHLTNGMKLVGDVAGPVYVVEDGKPKRYILHKRDKGPDGMKLKDLHYVKSIDFSDKAVEAARKELAAKSAAASRPASRKTYFKRVPSRAERAASKPAK